MGSSGLEHKCTRLRSAAGKHALPAISRPMLRWFLSYARFYVRRHMHAVRVSQEEKLRQLYGNPVLLYMNHPSWWDPMIAAVLAGCYLPNYAHYTPMDAAALDKYRFFRRLGLFGVTRNSFQSRRKLLEVATQALSRPYTAVWITPQGRFSDARERPVRLENGLTHLVRHTPECFVLPIAIEYSFWAESKPEALVRFGNAISARELRTSSGAQRTLELNLEETMDALQRTAIGRDKSAFREILGGNAGVGGVYDLWRRGKALMAGRAFNPEHGADRL